MRPKICVPIVASFRDVIVREAEKIAGLPVEMAEWRVDFYAGYEKELLSIVEELKNILHEKELIVTIRTEQEGGEPNGSRFSYFSFIKEVLSQGVADYVDVEVDRLSQSEELIQNWTRSGSTKIIGSYHDFNKTPTSEFIIGKLEEAKNVGCDVGKFACMPENAEDVECLLKATAQMKEKYPEFPLITMSMGELGKKTRLYGALYGSEVTFGTVGAASAPGQIAYEKMTEVFDNLYSGKKHIVLIGFMGVGKSTISQELHVQSGRKEWDTDAMIVEQEGKSIPDIFAENGEEYFRQTETDIIDELGSYEAAIISCGGGMALRDINVRKLQAIGNIVLLTADPETIYERVKDDTNRPILNGNMNVAYIRELMEKRRPFYEKAANITVKTDNRSISDIAKEILEKCTNI